MHKLAMTIKEKDPGASIRYRQAFTAVGGLVGAVAASSCCILPLLLFSLGVSGAWIGNLTRLARYQPYFITIAIASVGYGYWLVYRSSKIACAHGETCGRPLPNRLVKTGLILATALVVAALGFDVLATVLLSS
jgi:mercuric ion transport protein